MPTQASVRPRPGPATGVRTVAGDHPGGLAGRLGIAQLLLLPSGLWEETEAPGQRGCDGGRGDDSHPGRTSEPWDGGSRPVSWGRASSRSRPVLGHRRSVSRERPQTEWASQGVLPGAVSPCFCASHSTSCVGMFQSRRGRREEPLGEASKRKRRPGQDGMGGRWGLSWFSSLRTGLSSRARCPTSQAGLLSAVALASLRPPEGSRVGFGLTAASGYLSCLV